MPDCPFDQVVAQRWFAVELNNAVWDWLEAGNYQTPAAEGMLHAAHASCHHWLRVGGPENHARAACLVANAYAAVGEGPSALRHARRSVELTRAHADALADWDWAFAYDALARAHAANGERQQAGLMRLQAREFGRKIVDAQDKAFFDQWHRAGNWHELPAEA